MIQCFVSFSPFLYRWQWWTLWFINNKLGVFFAKGGTNSILGLKRKYGRFLDLYFFVHFIRNGDFFCWFLWKYHVNELDWFCAIYKTASFS